MCEQHRHGPTGQQTDVSNIGNNTVDGTNVGLLGVDNTSKKNLNEILSALASTEEEFKDQFLVPHVLKDKYAELVTPESKYSLLARKVTDLYGAKINLAYVQLDNDGGDQLAREMASQLKVLHAIMFK